MTNYGGTIRNIYSLVHYEVEENFKEKFSGKSEMNNLLKTGIIISIGLALHNIPEGLAIGTGFSLSLIHISIKMLQQ